MKYNIIQTQYNTQQMRQQTSCSGCKHKKQRAYPFLYLKLTSEHSCPIVCALGN